jgi:hypothetical protein
MSCRISTVSLRRLQDVPGPVVDRLWRASPSVHSFGFPFVRIHDINIYIHIIYVRYIEGMIGRMYLMSQRLGYLEPMTTGIFCTTPAHFFAGRDKSPKH